MDEHHLRLIEQTESIFGSRPERVNNRTETMQVTVLSQNIVKQLETFLSKNSDMVSETAFFHSFGNRRYLTIVLTSTECGLSVLLRTSFGEDKEAATQERKKCIAALKSKFPQNKKLFDELDQADGEAIAPC